MKLRGSPRRIAVMASSLLAAGALIALPASATAAPEGLDGTFKVHFPKGHPASNAPCPPDEFCGVGKLVGYGKATITIVDESFSEIPDSPCLSVSWVQAIDPLNGVGELVLNEEGTFCPAGRSGDSHAGPASYGHPASANLTYVVDGGASSGVFTGSQGTGNVRFLSAGGVGVWRLTGVLVFG